VVKKPLAKMQKGSREFEVDHTPILGTGRKKKSLRRLFSSAAGPRKKRKELGKKRKSLFDEG